MSETVNLGKLLKLNKTIRDATHVATINAKSTTWLNPGEVVFLHKGLDGIIASNKRIITNSSPTGVVDPFLRNKIAPNEEFWVLLYPDSVTNIHHSWSHPDLPEFEEKEEELEEDEDEYDDDDDDWCKKSCS